mmetsp:Transcript_47612/g.101179  ORF Transcript_47612/g.101179 Transcript_47612/m.101179 type:complete len:95 (-) Transcript_47612:208-492(-)
MRIVGISTLPIHLAAAVTPPFRSASVVFAFSVKHGWLAPAAGDGDGGRIRPPFGRLPPTRGRGREGRKRVTLVGIVVASTIVVIGAISVLIMRY